MPMKGAVDAMSEMLKRKVEEQNKLFNRMQEIQRAAETEGRDWTAEERTNWDAANAKIDEVSADIERLERAAKLDEIDLRQIVQGQGVEAPTTEDRAAEYDAAFRTFMRGGNDSLTAEQRRMMIENRAQSVGTPADGGYLVPEGYRAVMTETMKAFGGLLQHANVITTSTGNPLPWPKNNDTANKGAILAENTQIGQEGVVFDSESLGAWTYTSKLVLVSLQLLQDSAFNLDSWLPRKLGERIGRAVAEHLVTGDGSNKPEGIAYGATTGNGRAIEALDDTSISYEDIVNLEHAVDPAYRAGGNCRFIFNDATLAHLRKVRDGSGATAADGRPLWQPVPVPGMPATINGQPYTIDQGVAGVTASAKPILFGDFRAGYIVRQVLDVQAVRLAERYADYLQVGFFGFARLDGAPDDTAAVKALVMKAS